MELGQFRDLDHVSKATEALAAIDQFVVGAPAGNVVKPEFVGSYRLLMDYARMHLIIACLNAGAPATALALATPPVSAEGVPPEPAKSITIPGGSILGQFPPGLNGGIRG